MEGNTVQASARSLVVALDTSFSRALEVVRQTSDIAGFKVNHVLREAIGLSTAEMVKRIRQAGGEVKFLDYKVFDTPQGTGPYLRTLSDLGVPFVNVVTLAGSASLKAAVEMAAPMQVIAVHVLTTLAPADPANNQQSESEYFFGRLPLAAMLQFTEFALRCGAVGVVCSPLELEAVNRNFPGIVTFVPGVRMANDEIGHQVRVGTPYEVGRGGGTYPVVGSPIVDKASDPRAAAVAYNAEFARGQADRAPAG